MGKWQDEYERKWAAFARDTLRASFGRAYARHRVTADDKRELRALLRAMGSAFDPFDARHEPADVAPPAVRASSRHSRHRPRRTSAVRFETPVRGLLSTGVAPNDEEEEIAFPATQVLALGDGSDGNTSDTGMQSDASYVYQTPQPKTAVRRGVRQRSPAAAVSSVERQLKRRSNVSEARSSTSTFPAFTPRDLNDSRLSASQTLRRQVGSMSPIAAARLRFSVDNAFDDESRTTFGDHDESSVLYTMETETCTAIPAGRVHTPQPAARPARRETPVGDPGAVVDLDVSMQSMHLEGDDDDDEMVGDSGNPDETEQGPQETENEADESRVITTALDFKDMSDDDDDDDDDMLQAVKSQHTTPGKQVRVTTGRWHWSETTIPGESESPDTAEGMTQGDPLTAHTPEPQVATPVAHDVDAKEPEVIEIEEDLIPEPEGEDVDVNLYENDDMCAEAEAVPNTHGERVRLPTAADHGTPMSKMLKNRLRKAGLALSDEEKSNDSTMGKDLNPFDSSTGSAVQGSPTASSSSSPTSNAQKHNADARKRTSDARKLYYRTKLPLTVESTSTRADDRRRDRRQKLKKKLARIPYVVKVPECNFELAPYQREAVEWMMSREEQHQVDENDSQSVSSARQREMYYDRLTSKMRGGILADEMGLGKTVCCIALICESLKKVRGDQSSESSSSVGESNSDGLPRLKAPTLIITPLSILGQWEKEIREKTNLSVISYQGNSRRQIQNVMDFMGVDVVLSTYDTLRLKECKVTKGNRQRIESSDSEIDEESQDAGAVFDQLNDSRQWHTAARRLSNSKKPTPGSKLHQLMWHRVILDESHLITNPSCARAKAALILKSKRRWCVTGTPIQNSGKDLSSLMTFLGMSNVAADLDYHEVLSRVMLRRLKSTVDIDSNEPIVQLPEKQEETLELEFASDLEKAYYTLLHRSTKRRVFEYLQKHRGGAGGQFMHVFELLLRLRQCCDSCSLVSEDPRREIQDGNGTLLAQIGTLSRQEAALLESACATEPHSGAEIAAGFSTKIAALLLELREMKRKGECGLVISQWTSFLDLIGEAIQEENRHPSTNGAYNVLRFCRLDGRMSAREREQAIASFQVEKRVDIMLVSIRTGGLGLNLTAATQVFIMEPSWNPSIESQAIDRAHRVGQTRRVRIVRFLMKNTIEERVVELQRKKRELAKTTLGDGVPSSQAVPSSTKEAALTRDELRELFSQELDSDQDMSNRTEGAI